MIRLWCAKCRTPIARKLMKHYADKHPEVLKRYKLTEKK